MASPREPRDELVEILAETVLEMALREQRLHTKPTETGREPNARRRAAARRTEAKS